MHKHAMDTCFKITDYKVVNGKCVLNGLWINLGFVESHPIHQEVISINAEDFVHWKYCINPELQCLRNAKWVKILNYEQLIS